VGLIALLGGQGDYEAGAEVFDGGVVKDTAETFQAALAKAVEKCDVIVTTGGASVGRADYAKSVLEGADRCVVRFGRLHMKPGKPTTFATLDSHSFGCDETSGPRQKRWLFALPGNPVSALVTASLLVVPALRRLRGIAESACLPPEIRLKLAGDVVLDPVRPEYHRVGLEWHDSEGGARDWSTAPYRYRNSQGEFVGASTGNQRSSRLLSMRGADALACLPERERASLVSVGAKRVLPAGTTVAGLLLGPQPPLLSTGEAPFFVTSDQRAASTQDHACHSDVRKVTAVAVVARAGDDNKIRADVVTRVDAANAAAAVIARATGLAMFVRDGPPVIRANDAATILAQLSERAKEASILVVCGGLEMLPDEPPTAKALANARRAPGLARAMAVADDEPLETPIAAILDATLVLVLPGPATRAARCARAAAPALPTILKQLRTTRH
jgi:gephyrin